MGAKMSLELSDGLAELGRLFNDYTHEPRMLRPEDARAFIACCKELREEARRLENEISAKRWNEEAVRDRIVETGRILDAVRRPGSNVALFPMIPRPFSDGHPVGGA